MTADLIWIRHDIDMRAVADLTARRRTGTGAFEFVAQAQPMAAESSCVSFCGGP
ncbi:hypothetical protein ACFVKB_46220 [Rhodococcus sp. NPDC127530]|uniref:hypothetical protein n=1 Tax=unclassified Rhodococcus (in: high G+C Gram-positive bacteria) TaxID=192944 RepID=UPI0036277D25